MLFELQAFTIHTLWNTFINKLSRLHAYCAFLRSFINLNADIAKIRSCLGTAHSGYEATQRDRVSLRRRLCMFLRWRLRVLLEFLSVWRTDYRYNWVLKMVLVSWAINDSYKKKLMRNFSFTEFAKTYAEVSCVSQILLEIFLLCWECTFFKTSPYFTNKFCLTW